MKRLKLAAIILTLTVLATLVWGQTYKQWYDYTKMTQASGDDVLLICDDPNGVPATKNIGRDELLSSWTGSTAVTTVGTIGTGTWQGTAVADAYVADDITAASYLDLATYDALDDGFVDGNDTAYDATSWNANPNAPSMNAVRDKIESLAAGDMLKSVYDVLDDGFVDGNDTAYDATSWNANPNAPSMNAVRDKIESLAAGSTASSIVADESADAALSSLGDVHIRGDEDRISYHAGAGGEVAGEVTMSMLSMIAVTFDPGSQYDSNSVVALFKVQPKKFPNGIIIDYIEVDCLLDPDVEMDLDLCYADDWDDVADPNIIDILDTTTGKFSEDTDANINAGAAVAAGKVVYLRFGADPEGTCTELHVEIIYHSEED